MEKMTNAVRPKTESEELGEDKMILSQRILATAEWEGTEVSIDHSSKYVIIRFSDREEAMVYHLSDLAEAAFNASR